MPTNVEKQLLLFLNNHNDGQYRSEDLLFAHFMELHSAEYIDNQHIVRDAIDRCIKNNYIAHDSYPEYFIHITEKGRKIIME